MDFILAHSRYKRRKYPEAIQLCDQMLENNARDEVVVEVFRLPGC